MPIRRITVKTRQNTSVDWNPISYSSSPDDFDVGAYTITSTQENLSEDGLTLTVTKEFPTLDDLIRYDYDGYHSWVNGPKIHMANNSITFNVSSIDLDSNTIITPQQIDARAAELGFLKV